MPLARDIDVRFGKHDDGNEGVILTKIRQGDLVRIPVTSAGTFGTSGSGVSSSFTLGATGSNPDGTGNTIGLIAPNGQLTSIAWWETTVWGNRVGVRFLRNNNATQAPFAVVVDGVPYRVAPVQPKTMLGTVSSTSDYEGMFLVADDLGPGPHTVRVSLYGDPNGTGNRILNIMGLLADKSHAYTNPVAEQSGYFPSNGMGVTVPTAATAIPYAGKVAMMHFYNAGAASHTVTIKRGSATYAVVTVAAGQTAEVVFPVPVSLISWTWNVDTGTDVNGWTLTGAVGT